MSRILQAHSVDRTRHKEHNAANATTPAAEIPRRRADDLITTLIERVGGRFGVSSVFGPAVERDGVTVVPVATVRSGSEPVPPRRRRHSHVSSAAFFRQAIAHRERRP
jgi:hypothetical protein